MIFKPCVQQALDRGWFNKHEVEYGGLGEKCDQ